MTFRFKLSDGSIAWLAAVVLGLGILAWGVLAPQYPTTCGMVSEKCSSLPADQRLACLATLVQSPSCTPPPAPVEPVGAELLP